MSTHESFDYNETKKNSTSFKYHRLPRLYSEAAKILKEVIVSKRGLKDVIYSNRNRMLHKKFLGIIDKYLDNQNLINQFISDTELSNKVRDEYVAKILCTELMYGKQCLPIIENNTIQTINNTYENYKNSGNLSLLQNNCISNSNNLFDQYMSAKKKLRCVRINTLIINKEQLIDQLIQDGFIQLPNVNSYDEYLDIIQQYTSPTWERENEEHYFIEDYHLTDVFVFLQNTEFHNYNIYKDGWIFLQDKASCIPTHLLAPPPNSTVFDTCAAPGNKTLHLAAYMNNQGKIYAVDKDPKRFKYLEEVVKLANGGDVIQTIHSDIFEVRMADYTDVEYVLVDPSCSGTGIIERQKIDNHENIPISRIKNLSGFQKDLLSRVLSYFPNVKRVVYCTCSIREEENEQVVEDILNKHGHKFELENLKHSAILKEWKHFGNEKYKNGNKCFYALPNDYCTGFFAAVFNRKINYKNNRNDNEVNKFGENKFNNGFENELGKSNKYNNNINNHIDNEFEEANEEYNNIYIDKFNDNLQEIKNITKKRKQIFNENNINGKIIKENAIIVEEKKGGKQKHEKKKYDIKQFENELNKPIENEEIKRKSKKKKKDKDNDDINNEKHIEINEINSKEERKKKKKDKKIKLEQSENNIEEIIKNEEEIERKSKKKKNKNKSEELNNNIEVYINEIDKSQSKEKQKKSKKHKNEINSNEHIENDEEKIEKKIKKKNKEKENTKENESNIEIYNNIINESNEKEKRKKKKKEKTYLLEQDELVSNIINDENKQNKKKRNKDKIDDDDVFHENISKKKKKKKESKKEEDQECK